MKNMKRALSILLALALALTVSLTAFAAADTYTVTIDNAASGHTYEAYQVFSGTLSDDGSLTDVAWGSGVDGTALLAALKSDTTLGATFAGASTAAEAAAAMKSITDDSAEAQAFAKVAGANLKTAAGTSTGSNPYTISGLAAGYYLVKDKEASQDSKDDAYTRFILEVVKNVTASPKSDSPSVVKKVEENTKYITDGGYGTGYNDVADYEMGSTVPFELIGTLPSNYADYSTYKYIFDDNKCEGLTFNEDSVEVYADSTKLAASDYVTAFNGQNMTVTFNDLKAITDAAITKDTKITVKYTTTLNQNAVIGLDGNPNDVFLSYSNNPNAPSDTTGTGTTNMGKTPKDEVLVFTYELDTTKVDGSDAGKLAGAEFELYKTVDGTENYATVEDGKLTGWTTTEADASTLTSDENGLFKVAGLDDGTYALRETKAPSGYNSLAKDVELTIAATTVNNQSWTGTPSDALTALTITIDGQTDQGNTDTGVVNAAIENNKGLTLPSTGGIGTIIFYIAGGLLMAGAITFFVLKKKKTAKAE